MAGSRLRVKLAWILVTVSSVAIGRALADPGLRPFRCLEGDLIYDLVSDFPTFAPGETNTEGSNSPELAVKKFVEPYSGLGESLSEESRSSNRAVFQRVSGDRSDVRVVVGKEGGAWEVERFTACNSILIDSEK